LATGSWPDREALARELNRASPDVVVHELTDLPPRYMQLRKTMARTNRLREEGTRNLVEAAVCAGARRVVAQSIAFLYSPHGAAIKDEHGRPWTNAPPPFDGVVAALLELERAVAETNGIEGLVLRYGTFYGPGTWYAPDGDIANQVRRRRFPLVGSGNGLISWVHVQDAAAATVCALEQGAPGVFNVADDHPVPYREWLFAYARLLGAPPPLHVPAWVARLVVGQLAVAVVTQQRGASNAKAKRELQWEPRYADWQTGLAASLQSVPPT
jgi:nucleoside-diphosphate-sugar epimerase